MGVTSTFLKLSASLSVVVQTPSHFQYTMLNGLPLGVLQLGSQDYFGVRSYLHHFYEPGRNKKATSTSHCKYKYDWRTNSPQAHCTGVYWWKTMAMFGGG